MEGGALYLVATPIGNLGDLSHRAVEVLKSADLIACEDTRHSRVLLEHYGIRKPLTSYHDFSEKKRAPELVARVKQGANVALISDAGTPGIADPGFRLVAEAIREGVRVEALPGPSAFVTALVLSGFPTDRFAFEGFLPVKDGQRRNRLKALAEEDRTVIFYESPHRILKSLAAIRETLGDPLIAVARELTKKFEEVLRGKASEVEAKLSAGRPRGEFVIVLGPRR
jgi:16S rRNA (cytidine1402-2'-O)-methyltransferase